MENQCFQCLQCRREFDRAVYVQLSRGLKSPNKRLKTHRIKPQPLGTLTAMWIEECPKLTRQTLQAAGALGPGVKTRWAWPGVPAGPSIEVTGGAHTFTINELSSTPDNSGGVRVVVTKRGFVCPRCGAGCYQLLFDGSWGCRSCCKCQYRISHRPSPADVRLSLLRQLARADPLSLKAYELQRKLHRINRVLSKRARHVGERITAGRG